MSYFKLMNKEKSPEYLITKNLNVHGWQSFFSILFNQIIEITLIVSHDDV